MRFNWNDMPERHFKDVRRRWPSGLGPGSAQAVVSCGPLWTEGLHRPQPCFWNTSCQRYLRFVSNWVLFHVPWWHPLCLQDALGLPRPLRTQNKSHSTTMNTKGTALKWETLVSPVWCSPGDGLFTKNSQVHGADSWDTVCDPGIVWPLCALVKPFQLLSRDSA